MWMWLFWVVGIGIVPIAVVLLVVGAMVLFFTGTLGIDGLAAMAEKQGNLTCWHCGEETPAGQRRCSHCDGELQ